MNKIWIWLLLLTSVSVFALDEGFTEQDQLNFSFASQAPYSGQPPRYDGVFTAAKFWKLDASGNPAAQPELIYAYADVRDATSRDLLRVAFNGTTLKQLSAGRPFYAIKRTPEPFENWLSWYIHFNPTQFPKTLSLDSYMAGAALNIVFPPAYKISHSTPFVIGSSETQIQAIAQTGATPQYVDFKLYPSQTPLQGASYFWNGRTVNPANPVMGFIKTEYGGSGGWSYGDNNGLIGFSACNEKEMRFEGNKRYLFKACTIMVKPTNIVIVRP
jgi:hypothetical protein